LLARGRGGVSQTLKGGGLVGREICGSRRDRGGIKKGSKVP